MTTCKLCGADVEWLINDARAAGYDPDVHCQIRASKGVVVRCLDWLGWKYCESCPMAKGLFKDKPNKAQK